MEKKIAVIRGDGIGPEIVSEAIKVLDAVAAKDGHTFTYDEVDMGGAAGGATGATNNGGDDNVVDADYEVVDDDNNK